MTRILVVDGHPDRGETFCHALAQAYVSGARDGGHDTRFVRLADADFPLLRSAAEFQSPPTEAPIVSARDDILWAEHLVFVFPLWLGSAPALVRAFLEQVARAGFVAEVGPRGWTPRLKGRSARLIVTMGMPAFFYRLVFGAHGVKSIAQSILGFAGVRPVRETLIGGAEAPEAVQKKRIACVRELGEGAG
jgi:putative NADPH-quinone reductase